jgi:hypothetical protein
MSLNFIKIMMLQRSVRLFARRFSAQKSATGLVGLPVSEDGIQELKDVSSKILSKIQVCLKQYSI